MTRIGYARVSTNDQHPEAQSVRLSAAECTRIYEDKGASGKLARRPEWDKLLDRLEQGDVLVCTKLDRIGRSVRNLIEVADLLKQRGADLVVLDQGIDTTTAAGRMLFHVLAAIAEFESDLISERTKDALAATRARGRKGGRKDKLSPKQAQHVRELYAAKTHTIAEIGDIAGVRGPTVYRYVQLAGQDEKEVNRNR